MARIDSSRALLSIRVLAMSLVGALLPVLRDWWNSPVHRLIEIGLVALPVLVASLFLAWLVVGVAGLAPQNRLIGVPIISLPIIHLTLIWVTSDLMAEPANALVQLTPQQQLIRSWHNPSQLVPALASELMIFILVTRLRRT